MDLSFSSTTLIMTSIHRPALSLIVGITFKSQRTETKSRTISNNFMFERSKSQGTSFFNVLTTPTMMLLYLPDHEPILPSRWGHFFPSDVLVWWVQHRFFSKARQLIQTKSGECSCASLRLSVHNSNRERSFSYQSHCSVCLSLSLASVPLLSSYVIANIIHTCSNHTSLRCMINSCGQDVLLYHFRFSWKRARISSDFVHAGSGKNKSHLSHKHFWCLFPDIFRV